MLRILFGEADYSPEWDALEWAMFWLVIFFGQYWL